MTDDDPSSSTQDLVSPMNQSHSDSIGLDPESSSQSQVLQEFRPSDLAQDQVQQVDSLPTRRSDTPDLDEADPSSSDTAVTEMPSVEVVEEPDLETLRQKVLEDRGSRAELPAGWDDEQMAIEAPLANNTSDASSSTSDSSGDDDSDSSSDSSSDDDAATTRAADFVSDYDSDEDDRRNGDANGSGAAKGPTTKNELAPSKATALFGEVPFEQVPDPQLGEIRPLGQVHGCVEDVLVVAQLEEKIGSNYQTSSSSFVGRAIGGASNERQGPILDAGSLVCTADGKVIGLIFETFGSLLSPLYSILLPSVAIARSYAKDTPIHYLPSHSTILRPAELRAAQGKGSDASNVNDEEPMEWEAEAREFSDDEEEMEYKRQLKQKKKQGNKRTAGDENQAESSTRGSSRGGRGGSERGGGRGRGRGRGGSSTGPSHTPFALPAKPNWQLDDPSTAGSAGADAFSYDDDSATLARSKPKPYDDDIGLVPAPASAGLPAIPKLAAAESMVSQATNASPLASSMAPVKPPIQPAHSASPLPTRPAAPASALSPPPGAHINPLFAHMWNVPSTTTTTADQAGSSSCSQPTMSYQQQQQQQQQARQQYPMPQQWQQPQYAQQQQYYGQTAGSAAYNGYGYGNAASYQQQPQQGYPSHGGYGHPSTYQHQQYQQQQYPYYQQQQAGYAGQYGQQQQPYQATEGAYGGQNSSGANGAAGQQGSNGIGYDPSRPR